MKRNMRSAYAEVMVAAISGDAGSPLKMENGTFQARITLKQRQEDWQTAGVENMKIGGVPYDKWDSKLPAVGGTATVTYSPDSDDVIIDWSGNGSGSGSGSTYAFHGADHDIGEEEFCDIGVVIQDGTGTAVFYQSATHEMWVKYHDDKVSVSYLSEMYPDSLKMVDTKNIKDSSSAKGSLQVGDIFKCDDNSYRYVQIVDYDTREGNWPSSSWIELKQY